MLRFMPGTPFTRTAPPASSRSSGEASMQARRRLPDLVGDERARRGGRRCRRSPPGGSQRRQGRAGSPRCRRRSRGYRPAATCSTSAAICASMVLTPWPCAVAPVVTTILPDGPMRIARSRTARARCLRHNCRARCRGAALAPRGLAARREIRPAGGRQRAALAFRIVAAVIDHRAAVALRHRRRIGHLFGRDEIAAADFVAREPERVRRRGRAGAPSQRCPAAARRRASACPAACWSGRTGCRCDRPAAHRGRSGWSRHCRAGRRHRACWRRGRDRAGRGCRAAARPQSKAASDVPDLVAFGGGGDEILGAVLDPFDRLRRSSIAAAATASSSGWNTAFGPKPPPTSGAITRT